MRVRAGIVLASGIAWIACAGTGAAPSVDRADRAGLPRAEPGVLYAMGASLGQTLDAYDFDEDEARELGQGFIDTATHRPYSGVRTDQTAEQVATFHEARLKELARREEQAGQPLLESAAKEPGAVLTETGLVLRVIDPGSGPSPDIFDWVTINYKGTLRDGSVFFTNDGQAPYRVQLGTTTRCWQQAFGAVAKGARVHAVCPPSLNYGWGGWPGVVPGGAVLSYDLELLEVEPDAKK
jgi:FKBP-type peptidyl-prolyl cis-trans isomerase FkpA